MKKKIEEKQENEEFNQQSKVITLDDIIGKTDEKPVEPIAEPKASDVVLPSGMREIRLEDVESEKKVKYIDNPLPVPKRREHKEMNYAIELTPENDDYDIKDMTGMDYFDIE